MDPSLKKFPELLEMAGNFMKMFTFSTLKKEYFPQKLFTKIRYLTTVSQKPEI